MTDPYTPTRVMAQSAGQTAQNAYAAARQAISRCEALEALVSDLQERLAMLERPAAIKRKAA